MFLMNALGRLGILPFVLQSNRVRGSIHGNGEKERERAIERVDRNR